MEDFIQVNDTPTTKGTDHTPIMVPDIGDISAGHNPTPVPTTTEAAALEGTLCNPLPATAAAYTALQPMDTPVTPHTVIPTGIVTPHPALAISPTGTTHATPQTGAGITPATPTAQHRDLSPEKSSNAQDPQPPINPTTPRLSPSRFPFRFFIRF